MLLKWYRAEGRDLPWRRSRDPYRVWVSEIMLQQTRVRTAAPYYQRFLQRFPTVHELASAPLDDVLKQWQGLGYYTRARNLHRAAQRLVASSFSTWPRTAEDWRSVPGVGRYTAAAIASICHNEPVAALDGNIRRVLSRLNAIGSAVSKRVLTEKLWRVAQATLDPDSPGDFNQSLMELGATICLPRTPRCAACPLRTHCAARRAGIQHELPRATTRGRPPVVQAVACAVWRQERLLMLQRRPAGLLGGLWELPGVRLDADDHTSPSRAAGGTTAPDPVDGSRLRGWLNREYGLQMTDVRLLGHVVHEFTHQRRMVHVFEGTCIAGRLARLAGAGHIRAVWVRPAALERLALARLDQKILRVVKQARRISADT